MTKTYGADILDWHRARHAIAALGLFCVQAFAWNSHATTLFNGLAAPLFFVLLAYLALLATQSPISVSTRSLCLFGLFSVWAIVADARSGQFLPALAKDTHWFVMPIACLLIARAFPDGRSILTIARGGALLCIAAFLMKVVLEAEWYDSWSRVPIFGSPRHLGMTMGMMSVLLYGRRETNSKLDIAFRCARIIGLAIVYWTGTRSAILAWIICATMFACLDPTLRKSILLDNVAAIVLSFSQPPPYLTGKEVALPQFLGGTRLTQAEKVSLDWYSSSRLTMWSNTLLALNEAGGIWTGLGGNGYVRMQVLHGIDFFPRGHVHAHNVVIQSICDWGVPGTILLGAFAVQTLLRTAIGCLKTHDATALAGVTYIVVTSMFDATLYHLEHMIYLVIAASILFARRTGAPEVTLTVRRPALLGCLAAMALVHALAFDYSTGLYWYFPSR